MESVSSYFLQRQNWRENIFTVVESWTGVSESYVSSSDTDSLTIEYVDVENNVRFAIIFAKNVSIFSGNFPNQKCCFRFSLLSLSLSSFQHLANNEIWLWISVCLLIAFRFQQFDISSRRDEIRGTTEKQFSFGKQRLARITRSFIFYANRIILNRNFSTIMYTVYVSFVRAR